MLLEPAGLGTGYGDLGFRAVRHLELDRAVEPRNNLLDAEEVHEVGAMDPPKNGRVQAGRQIPREFGGSTSPLTRKVTILTTPSSTMA